MIKGVIKKIEYVKSAKKFDGNVQRIDTIIDINNMSLMYIGKLNYKVGDFVHVTYEIMKLNNIYFIIDNINRIKT